MPELRLNVNAMATRFELLVHGHDPVELRAAAEEALAEVTELDVQLNVYSPASELSRINKHAGQGPVRVEARLFRLFQEIRRLHMLCQGAVDPAMGRLIQCWRRAERRKRIPSEKQIQQARRESGFEHVHLDDQTQAVFFDRPGLRLNLSAFAKGYALDCAGSILKEAGIQSAFLHGGTSSILTIGSPQDQPHWAVRVAQAPAEKSVAQFPRTPAGAHDANTFLLLDNALSVSAVWGRGFTSKGSFYGHILDPRTGWPVQHSNLAAVAAPTALYAEAFSTALVVLGQEGLELLANINPGSKTLLLSGSSFVET